MSEGSEINFAELQRLVRDGSEDAAAEFIRRFGPWMRSVVARRLPKEMRRQFDSCDFVQTAWASIFADRQQFGRFASLDDFLSFAAQLASNKVAAESRRRLTSRSFGIRREQLYADVPLDVNDIPAPQSPTPSQEAVASERWAQMIADKPEALRLILELRREGRTFSEIADRVGHSESHIRRLYQAALIRETQR